MDRTLTPRSYAWPLAVLTAGALALRLFRLDAQSAWIDEAFTIHAAVQPWPAMMQMLVGDFNHPPLHTILIRWWFEIVGVGVWEARLPSALAGAAAVPALYWLGRQLFDGRTAFLAAVLLTTSQLATVYSQEARAYELLLLVTLLASIFFVRADRSGRTGDFIAFVALGTIAMYLHYYAAFFLLACWVFTLLARPRSAVPQRWWLIAGAAGVILYLPWLLSGVIDSVIANPGSATVENVTAKLATPLYALNWFNSGKVAGVRSEAPRWAFAAGLLIVTLPALRGALSALTTRAAPAAPARSVRFVVVTLAFPILCVWLLGLLQVVYDVRHVAHVAGAYYLLAAVGVFAIRNRAVRMLFMAAVLLWPLVAFRATFTQPYKENVRDGLDVFVSQYQPGDCVVFGAGNGPSFLHLYWRAHQPGRPLPPLMSVDDVMTKPDCSRAWLLWERSPWKSGPNTIERAQAKIAGAYQPAGSWLFTGVDVRLYKR